MSTWRKFVLANATNGIEVTTINASLGANIGEDNTIPSDLDGSIVVGRNGIIPYRMKGVIAYNSLSTDKTPEYNTNAYTFVSVLDHSTMTEQVEQTFFFVINGSNSLYLTASDTSALLRFGINGLISFSNQGIIEKSAFSMSALIDLSSRAVISSGIYNLVSLKASNGLYPLLYDCEIVTPAGGNDSSYSLGFKIKNLAAICDNWGKGTNSRWFAGAKIQGVFDTEVIELLPGDK